MSEKLENVHRYFDKDGNECWGVGVWNQDAGQYHAPLDTESRQLTGCGAEFARRPIGCYRTAKAAKREARRLWGYARES